MVQGLWLQAPNAGGLVLSLGRELDPTQAVAKSLSATTKQSSKSQLRPSTAKQINK